MEGMSQSKWALPHYPFLRKATKQRSRGGGPYRSGHIALSLTHGEMEAERKKRISWQAWNAIRISGMNEPFHPFIPSAISLGPFQLSHHYLKFSHQEWM